MTTTQLDVPLVPSPAERLLPRLASDTRYVLTGLPTALATAIVCVTGFAAGSVLAVAWIGVPMMVFALAQARRFAEAERERIAVVLGEPVVAPAYRDTTGAGPLRRLATIVADPQSWRDLAHAALRILPSGVAFSLTATWWAGVLGGLSWSLWGWSLPNGPGDNELPELLGLGDGYPTTVVFYFGLAAVFAITLPAVVRAAALLEARFARALLTRRG